MREGGEYGTAEVAGERLPDADLVCSERYAGLRRRFPTGSLTDWRNLLKDGFGDGQSCRVRGSHTVLESQKNTLLAPVPTRTESLALTS